MHIDVEVALISAVSAIIGGLLVAVVNHLFLRNKTEAEAEKLRAEAEKIKIETEKMRQEISKASSEAAKLGDAVEKATSLIAGSLSESETSRRLTQEIIRSIHKYLREHKSERCDRKELIEAVSPILKSDAAMSEFMIDNLISKGYLTEPSPGRYELSRTAIQKFIQGGAK